MEYGDFYYQANTWRQPRRVVFKVEKPSNQMMHLYTFIVTSMKSEPYQVVRFYCNRGNMENMIKEGKSGFDFSAVSSSSKAVNANRLCNSYNGLQFIKLVPQSGSSGGNEEAAD